MKTIFALVIFLFIGQIFTHFGWRGYRHRFGFGSPCGIGLGWGYGGCGLGFNDGYWGFNNGLGFNNGINNSNLVNNNVNSNSIAVAA